MIALINGSFSNIEEASLHVSDLSIQRGYAAFDFLRTLHSQPLFIDDHLDRFFRSVDLLRLKPGYSKQQVKEFIFQLIEENKMEVSGIRMMMTGGFSPGGYETATPNLVITQHVLTAPPTEDLKQGIDIITHEYQRDLPQIKSTNYLMGVWLQQTIKEKGATDVLYHQNNTVTEFPRSNIFMVNDKGELLTPQKNILEGITRKKLLHIAPSFMPVIEKNITVDEIKNAAELFMTSTTKRILPISQVDDTMIADGKAGPLTIALHNAFLTFEKESIK